MRFSWEQNKRTVGSTPDHGRVSAVEITFRDYRPGDERLILELYNGVFSGERTAEQWLWEFMDNPAGRFDILLAFSGERLIGHSAGVPLMFRHGGKIVQASRMQNAVIHPDFHRRGIFTEIFKRLTGQAASRGADFALALAHDARHSLTGAMRSGLYTNLFDILRWGRAIPPAAPMPAGTRVEITDRMRFGDEDILCAEKFLEPFAIYNRRDLSYLDWRFSPASGKRYTMARVWRDGRQVGWAVAKPYPPGRSIDLVELFLPTEPALIAAMLAALAEHFRGQVVDRMSVWSMEHYPLQACLLELGFAAEAGPTHILISQLSARCSPRSMESTAYYLAMGDSDVY